MLEIIYNIRIIIVKGRNLFLLSTRLSINNTTNTTKTKSIFKQLQLVEKNEYYNELLIFQISKFLS